MAKLKRIRVWHAPHIHGAAYVVQTKRGTWLAVLRLRGLRLRQEYASRRDAIRALRAYVGTFVMP
ncbi:MAG: hypothetical protein N2545_07980 [Thermoflexales bacterium]|nr:hypothetical protein [Thermoflexales bacterium]